MKKVIAALTLFPVLVLNGHAATSGSFTYETANSQVTITGYTGPDGAVTIPSEINYLPVTRIGSNAFNYNRSLNGITIPSSVTTIGESAFEGCSGLQSVSIPNSVTTIGDSAFFKCSSLSGVTIPISVKTIADNAFAACSSLKSMAIPASVTSIGEMAFAGCESMASFAVDANNANFSAFDGILFNKNKTTLIVYPATKSENTYTIPSSVSSISSTAFAFCGALTQMQIPSRVTNIGWGAFGFCSRLANITVDLSNPNFSEIEGVLFDRNQTTLLGYPAGKSDDTYSIPANVTSIGRGGFAGCENLTHIRIPSSVQSIGREAFNECRGLNSIEIPRGVTSIGESTFEDCTNLICIRIPNSVTTIWDDAFSGCISLTDITIPDSVISIGWDSFSNCSGLTSITIPLSVTSIGPWAFSDCNNLTGIYFMGNAPPDVPLVSYSDNLRVNYLPGTSGWGDSFGGLPTFEMVSDQTPDGLRYLATATEVIITGYSRSGTVINIPEKIGNLPVTRIVYGAFDNCEEITHVTIPDSVIVLEESAFDHCTSLTSVTLGSGVTTIGDSAFQSCTGLKSITIPSSVHVISACAFQDSGLTSLTISNSVTSIGHSAFGSCSSLTSVSIPASVTSIGYWAFVACEALESFAVDKDNPNYSSESEVLFNKNQTTLIQYPASKSGSAYVIPGSVKSIGDLAFWVTAALTEIQIPSSVTEIGMGPFPGCSNLTAITVHSGNPNYSDSNGILFDKAQTKLIQYPAGRSGVTYSIPVSVNSIGEGAFFVCERLTSMTIPYGVTSIGEATFMECRGLTSVTIPDSVKSIGKGAFTDCTGLTHITIPDSVTYIDDDAFADCTGLTSIIIGNSVTQIWDYSFGGCTGLTNIVIPNSVTRLGDGAFKYCTGLTSITIPDSVTYIDDDAFADCSSLTSITIPSGVAGIEENAPWGSSAEITRVDPPTIALQPFGAIFKLGGSTNFSVTATGTNLSYQWKKNGVNILNATGATLSLSNAQTSDAASYTVVVSNAVGGVTSNPAVLAMTVPPPTSLVGKVMVSYIESESGGDEYLFLKSADQLFFVDAEESGNHGYKYESDSGRFEDLYFEEVSTLSFISESKGIEFSNGDSTGDWSFILYDSSWDLDFDGVPDGLQIERGNLPNLIHPLDLSSDVDGDGLSLAREGELGTNPSKADISPSITAQPVTATANQGGSVTFSVTATGTNPSYQWKKNGLNILNATGATLSLSNAQASDAASYTVTVSNAVGSVTSTVAQLAVVIPPGITVQPVAATANQGASASFSVTATGTNLSYQWKRNGADLAGETGDTLVLDNLQGTRTGFYTVVVSNAIGSVTSDDALLTVVIPPAITEQPADVTFNQGGSGSFHITATGTNLSYQWKRNGADLAGETGAMLSLNNLQGTQAGSYTVAVSNSAGSVTSNAAVLTVLGITSDLDRLTLKVGAAMSYAVTANPVPTTYVAKSLPPGLKINAKTGVIFGKPTKAGEYTVTLQALRKGAATLSAVKTFRVLQAPTFKLPAKVNVTRNKAFRSSLKVLAYPSASFSVVSGALPEGITLNPTTGQISGKTDTVKGNYPLTIRGSNEAGTTDKNTVLVVK